MKKLFPGMLLAFLVCHAAHANRYADTLLTRSRTHANPVNNVPKQVTSLSDLDQLLSAQSLQYASQPEGFSQQFFDQFNAAFDDTEVDVYRKKAMSAIAEVESSDNYVDVLDPSDLNKLPLGLKKRVGNSDVTIAVSSVVFTPRYAELTIFCRINIPQSPNKIYFGVQGVKLSHQGGIIGDAKLVLLGDIVIPINGNNGALVLKGGMNIQTGQGSNLTYVSMDCNGFKELKLTAEVQFPKTMLIPVDAQGVQLPGRVAASFSTTVQNWNDILVENLTIPRFEIVGLKGISFDLSNVSFDFSDYHNSGSIVYPAGYQQKYMIPGNPNIWRGVYAKNISISLPKAFKDRTTSQRVSFGVNDLIIDNNGISGIFYAQNVLPISKGTATGWKFSVDSIRIGIEANRLTRAGFGGKIGLPVTKNDDDTANKKKFLAYYAYITANSDYVCRVTAMDELEFNVWKAKAILKPNSYVQLVGNSDGFRPEAMLHGSMGIVARGYDSNPDRAEGKDPVADMKGIEFRSLHLKTTQPYISAEYFGYNGEIKVGNFPVSLDSISLTSNPATNEAELGFKLTLNFHENEFGGSTRMRIIGKLNENEGLTSWSYSKLKIDDVRIFANVKDAFKLDGYLKFMDDDPIYGDGFDGTIHAEIKKAVTVTVDVRAIFGKKPFRYWFFDGKVDLGNVGISTGTGFNINGFAGGAYYRMKKQGLDNNIPSGLKYVPDSTAGLGLRAGILFNWGSDKVASGEASFEIAFNRNGGMRYVGLFGFVKVMKDILPDGFGIENYVKTKFSAIEARATQLIGDTARLNQMKIFQPSAAAKESFPTHNNEQPGQQGLSAYVGIQYDFAAHSLHANFDLYINAAGGLLKGAASGNRAGWAVLHIAPSVWYLHMGKPNDRLGVKFGIGSFNIQTGAYFMVGHEIPAFPPPPPQVISILNQSGLTYNNNISQAQLQMGKGLAFGANVAVSTGDIRFLIFYANFSAGLGFDVMIKDWGDSRCAGSNDRIGINGWYAEGQAYAYLQGELGVRIKLLFIKKKIPIIKGGAAALLQAKLPNPTWVGGYMGFHVSILGGLISGSFNFKFSFGNQCQIIQDTASDYEDFKVIAGITPAHQSTNLSLTVQPELSFNLKPGAILEMENNNGALERFYPQLEYFKVVESSNVNNVVDGYVKYVNNGYGMVLEPREMLKPNTDYKVLAKVTFYEYKHNSWAVMTENGQRVEEVKEFAFRTGLGPDTIPHNNIVRMYPFFNQRNFYKDEPRNGMVMLNIGMAYLFNSYNTWKAVIKTTNGQVVGNAPATYTSASNKLSYTLPANLSLATTYKVEVIGENTNGSNPMARPILSFNMTTSLYSTLSQKVQTMQMTQAVVGRISSDAIDLQAKVANYEGFEKYELIGNNYTGNYPLVTGEAITDDSYYNTFIKPLIYNVIPLTDGSHDFYIQNRYSWELGAPPVKAIRISAYYLNALQGGMYNEYVKTRMPYIYDLVRYYNRDFNDLRTQVINYYLNMTYPPPTYPGGGGGQYGGNHWDEGCNCFVVEREEFFDDGGGGGSYMPPVEIINQVPQTFHPLVTSAFPFISQGYYKVKFKFMTPDGTQGSNGEFKYHNPIQ
jgi:hypothetical protein